MRGRAAISLPLVVFIIFVFNASLIATAIAGSTAEAGAPAEPATRAASGGKQELAAAPSGAVTGPEAGTLLLCSVSSPEIRAEFLKLAGGSEARIVMIVNHVPDGGDPVDAERAAEAWGVAKVTFWRLTDRRSAEDKSLLAALGHATGVLIPGGKPPEYLEALVDSSAHRALAALLARGGVIGGESAGAVVQSTFVALPPGAPYAGPALEGLGFARNLAIFPHFGASAKFPAKFCEGLVAEHKGLAGLALPDGSAVIVRGRSVEVIGKGHVELIWRGMDGNVTTTTHASAGHFMLPEETK